MTTTMRLPRRDAAQQPQGRDCTNPRGPIWQSGRRDAMLRCVPGGRRAPRRTCKTVSQIRKRGACAGRAACGRYRKKMNGPRSDAQAERRHGLPIARRSDECGDRLACRIDHEQARAQARL
ncbi:hypothetical protein M3605_22400, partial [Bacillus subtilis]|nr:hypothetical protein [Bacillus subtilis]